MRYFLQNVVTSSVFELAECSLHKNGAEFRQEENSTIYRGSIRPQPLQSGTRNHTLALQFQCLARAQRTLGQMYTNVICLLDTFTNILTSNKLNENEETIVYLIHNLLTVVFLIDFPSIFSKIRSF